VLGNESLTSFATIAIGAAAIWGLHVGREVLPGSAVVATVSLILSGC
jgi:hypothetical protein